MVFDIVSSYLILVSYNVQKLETEENSQYKEISLPSGLVFHIMEDQAWGETLENKSFNKLKCLYFPVYTLIHIMYTLYIIAAYNPKDSSVVVRVAA